MAITLDERPIFIIGSERSGTTLVLAILACHPRIAVPEVTWYYPDFDPIYILMATSKVLKILIPLPMKWLTDCGCRSGA